MVDMLKLVGAV